MVVGKREEHPIIRLEILADPDTARRLTETLRVRISGQLVATKGTVVTCEQRFNEPQIKAPYEVVTSVCSLQARIDRVTIEEGGTVRASWTYDDEAVGRKDELRGEGTRRAPSATITRPDWARKPSGDDMARYYPDGAQRRNISGRATISCTVTAKGTLETCSVKSETPADYGFGEAAVLLSRLYRMKPRTLDGEAIDGGQVDVPLVFQVPQ